MASQEGRLIGHYRLLPLLSSGGMGSTYLAVDTLQDTRQVAIEIFPTRSNEELQSKERAAQLLVGLNHPNILRTFEFGAEEDLFYTVYEYIPRGTLRQRHPRGTKVPLTTVVSYVKQVAAALQYIHDHGMVHGDVKPEKMFINAEGKILLGDFGITMTLADKDVVSTTGIMGTPTYMAPEQIQGQLRRASDQYALGIVVYEWLSGRPPFSGTLPELIFKQRMEKPISPRSIAPEIPLEVEMVVMIALEKDPRMRFGSVRAFANALEQSSRSSLHDAPRPVVPYGAIPVPGMANQGMAVPQPSPATRIYLDSSHLSVPSPPLTQSISARRARRRLIPFFAGRREKKRRSTELSLFAIARTTLERNDRAIVGKIYTLQAGVSQQREEQFQSVAFQISVQDPLQAIPFHILFHPGENIELLGAPYQRLLYNPGRTEPQFISCRFRLKAPGQSYLLINFYRERQWLKTIRFAFDGVEQSTSSPIPERR